MIFFLEYDGEVIAVERGELGYHMIATKSNANDLNIRALPREVAESALAASMFGWDTPAARLANNWAEACDD